MTKTYFNTLNLNKMLIINHNLQLYPNQVRTSIANNLIFAGITKCNNFCTTKIGVECNVTCLLSFYTSYRTLVHISSIIYNTPVSTHYEILDTEKSSPYNRDLLIAGVLICGTKCTMIFYAEKSCRYKNQFL